MADSWWDTAPERHLLTDGYKLFARVVGWDRAIDIGLRVLQEKRIPSSRGVRNRATGRGALYVPQHISESRPQGIVRIAGLEDSRKLAKELGGEMYFFGNIEPLFIGYRNRAIVSQVDSGFSHAVVAAGFGICERQVRRICEKEK